MKIHITSFASESFKIQQEKQNQIFLKVGFVPEEIHLYEPQMLDDQFFKKQPDSFESNKFGWYSFKPYYLGMLLKKIDEGDILFFIDSNDKPKIGIKEYLMHQFKKNKNLEILCCSTNYPNIIYLSDFHKKILKLNLLLDSFVFCQPETGALGIRNTSLSRSIVRIWYELTLSNAFKLNSKLFLKNPSRPCQETMFILSRIYKSIKLESWYKFKLTGKGMRSFINFESLRDS